MAAAAGRLTSSQPSERLPRWPRSRAAVVVRVILQGVLLFPLVRVICRPIRVEGARGLGRERGPFVFAANHASHADTALLLRALPGRIRRRTAAAAAEDYFFRGRLRGALATLGIGAFPFPRKGTTGLDRAEELLADGWSVILFPEGTRSPDGRMRPFRSGIGVLAARGATVVPVGIAGSREVFPKSARLPRRAPVSVVFGSPSRTELGAPAQTTAQALERKVSRMRAAAHLLRPRPRDTWFDRARTLARAPAALWICFGWGVAEALWLPIVPDVPVALLAAAAPSRLLLLAVAAVAGSMTGGMVAYALGAAGAGGWLLSHAPMVTDRMQIHAAGQLTVEGAPTLLAQPWTGIPFKVFGYQAVSSGIGAGPFLLMSLAGRGFRILVAGGVFAVAFWPLHRFIPRLARRLYAPFALAFAVVFGMGLARVVATWS
jgi:1-acyl-sn-glycerol-3-phosphate acyltransferase